MRDAHSTIVLFGSLHVLPPGLDWRTPQLTQALSRANDLWFETPMDDASQTRMAELAAARGRMPNSRLSELLGRRARARLARLEARLGLSPAALDVMAPWMADASLDAALWARRGASQSDGVEAVLQRETPGSVRRRAFETVPETVDAMASAPLRDQAAALKQTLQDLETDPDSYQAVVDAWMAGDVAALARQGDRRLKLTAPDTYRRLVAARNARWVRKVLARLKGHGVTVMVVGVGHLVGPDGLPARLRGLGVRVEGP